MRTTPGPTTAFLLLISLFNFPVLITQSKLTTRYSTSPKHSQLATVAATKFSASWDTAPAPADPIIAFPEKHQQTHKEKIYSWMTGFFSGVIAGGLSGYFVCWVYKLTRKPPTPGSVPELQMNNWAGIVESFDKQFAWLQRRDSLIGLPVIGRGGCGEVYRAEVPTGENGEVISIAIKKVVEEGIEVEQQNEKRNENRVKKKNNKKMHQVISEIITVGEIRHRNILPLLAHVRRQDCQLLVYPLMQNGSLQDVLTEVARGTRKLNWPTRLRIAQGVAAGLEHLHAGHSPGILHRDLKPANILLDDSLEAQISDFGLALAIPDYHTHVTVSRFGGTPGYMAPEYFRGLLRYSAKCDIYSFGVILGVLVTGKFPLDAFFRRKVDMSLVDWMRKMMESENRTELIDPSLMANGGRRYVEEMHQVLRIALGCTLDDPKQRPTSRVVGLELSRISRHRKMLAGISIDELSEVSYLSQKPEEEEEEEESNDTDVSGRLSRIQDLSREEEEEEEEESNDTDVSGRLSRIQDLSRYYASSTSLSTAEVTGERGRGSFSTGNLSPATVETDEAEEEGLQHMN